MLRVLWPPQSLAPQKAWSQRLPYAMGGVFCGQLPAVPGASASLCLAWRVGCPTQRFKMLGSAFTVEQAGQPPWAGPGACGGPSAFGASCVTAAGGGPAYLQPHLPLARLAPSQACFPEPRADPALRLLFWSLAAP